MTDRKVPTPTILRDLLVQSVRQCNPIGMTLVDHFVAHPMFAIVFPLQPASVWIDGVHLH